MLRACAVTEAARSLGPQLRVLALPEDLDPEGDDWELLTQLGHRLTNCETLLEALPACPPACPIAVTNGDVVGAACGNYQAAGDMLRTRARWVALGALDARQRDANRAQGGPNTAQHLAA